MITAKSITKTFGAGGAKALCGVDVTIEKGEFVAVMGPSGSGKSTLLFTLSGMDGVTSGSVRFDGQELSGMGENELADLRGTKMGFVFQQPTMLKNLSILDNIILPAMRGGKGDTAALVRKAKALMARTGITGLEDRAVTEVSGGQLQRAGICRALMNSPEILFADEPTGALNSKAAEEIMALLADINSEGAAILLVTHDARIAARAGRVLLTKDGLVAAELPLWEYSRDDLDARTESILAGMASVGI